MAEGNRKLKEQNVFRVFYSSPFNGMEGEREELTRRYWPQLSSLCGSVGVRFVPIDMRWGITTDQSSNHQTINICLREIDRSDLFVGFFGQRYGWRGLDDAELQMTFDAAIPRYPWLEGFRDRSVTELEFLHGHLNNPGEIPAVICFRDKAFDDLKRTEGEKAGDKREVYKYSTESDDSAQCLKNLIQRVQDTEKSCLAVRIGYSTPADGAKFMFEHTKQFIEDVVLKHKSDQQTQRAKEQDQHHTYLSSHSQSYHGGEEYFSTLNSFVFDSTDSKPLLVVGMSGRGKSALLSSWIKKYKEAYPDDICLYHFIEATQNSNDPTNILQRMTAGLIFELSRDQSTEEKDDDYKYLKNMSDVNLLNECQKWLTKAHANNRRVVIVIDELQKIKYKEKIARPLFWLPTSIPSGIHIILSTDFTDTIHHQELIGGRGCSVLNIQPLGAGPKTSLCLEILKQRGKTLSDDQLGRVIGAQKASNPLFLKILLEELCAFGKFRELDKKIDSLISCSDIEQLFDKYLERLESDYNDNSSDENIVGKIMSHLHVSRHGLRESDIMEICNIQSHVWSPIYYALESFLDKMASGFFRLSQSSLKFAIYERYIANEQTEKSILNEQINYLERSYSTMLIREEPVPDYLYTELPRLCCNAADKDKLTKLILTVPIFIKVYDLQKYELLEYFNFIDMSAEDAIEKFDSAINQHMVDLYSSETEDLLLKPNVVQKIISVIDIYAQFFSLARRVQVNIHFLQKMQRLCETCTKLPESYRNHTKHLATYRLACLYVDMKMHNKALPLHTAVRDFYENKEDKHEDELCLLARSYHGMGTAYMALKNFDEAHRSFTESMRIHVQMSHTQDSKHDILASQSCIAQIYADKGEYELARDTYEEVISAEEELYKECMPSEMSYSMTNLGICYRRLKQFDKAEVVYKKALQIKERALGRNHFDVAYAYFNLSNLAGDREQLDEALQYMQTALEIFQITGVGDSIDAMYAKENIALLYLRKRRMDEGLPLFWDVFDYVSERNQLELCLQVVFDNYLIHLLRTNDHSGVRRVARQMIRCEKMRSFLPYLFLHYVDSLHPTDNDTPLSEEESIDHAIQLYPTQKDLIYQKIELDILPNKDASKINKSIEVYESNVEEFDESLIIQVGDLLEKSEWQEGAKEVYEYWHNFQPNCEAFLRNLAVLYFKMKQEQKSLEYFQKAAAINPTDPALKEKIAYLSLCTGDTKVCSEAIQDLESNWSDNIKLMEQVKMYKEELVKIQANV